MKKLYISLIALVLVAITVITMAATVFASDPPAFFPRESELTVPPSSLNIAPITSPLTGATYEGAEAFFTVIAKFDTDTLIAIAHGYPVNMLPQVMQ